MREHILWLLQRHLPAALKPGAGGNVLTKCPFHKGGQERKPSFSVNVETGLFHCFTCHVAGPIQYMLRLLGLPREVVDAEVAAILPELEAGKRKQEFEKEHLFRSRDPFRTDYPLPESLLGVYDWCPTKLTDAGFDARLLQDMEIGFDKQQNRITYPLRDLYGTLTGISGGAMSSVQQPKYLVYQGGRWNTGKTWVKSDFGDWFDEQFPNFTCENHQLIWNYHRVYPRALMAESGQDDTVYVVEGFKACLWMIQCGYYNTVALMGSYISETQQRLLHRLGSTVVLLLDNDNAGRRATTRIARLLWRPLYGHLRIAQYPDEDVKASITDGDDTQPDDYEAQGIHLMVANSLDLPGHLKKWGNDHGR